MDSHLVLDIKKAEGASLKAYKDSLGFWTVGYGHLLDQAKDWTTYRITKDQAEQYLEEDLTQAQSRCIQLPEWPSLNTLCRQNALVELEFNMNGKWLKFVKARLYIRNSLWQAAHDALLDSLWAKQVGPTRSNRLANYLLTGQYP